MSFHKDCCLAFRRPGAKALLLKSLAVLLAYVSWAFNLGIANSLSWRVWETNSNSIAVVYIGFWETSYVETMNVSGQKLHVSVWAKLNGSWGIPAEISYGQDLLLLANFLAPVALVSGTLAIWASWHRAPFPHFFRTCYRTAALHQALSGVCLTLAVAWNFAADLAGQTALEFPAHFPVNRRMIQSKRVSYVLPLGVLASVCSLLAVILFSLDSCSAEEAEKERAKSIPTLIPSEAYTPEWWQELS